MKYATLGVSIVLGLLFTAAAGYFFFGPTPPPLPEGNMAKFSDVLTSTGFFKAVKVLELIIGLMLVTGFKRPLATMLITPIVVGILFTEIFIMRQPGVGLVMLAMLGFLFYEIGRAHV